MAISRIDQLKNAGIIKDAKDVLSDAAELIGSLTDDEFHAILTARAKIDPANQQIFDQTILKAGF